jgi:hypothetical protein
VALVELAEVLVGSLRAAYLGTRAIVSVGSIVYVTNVFSLMLEMGGEIGDINFGRDDVPTAAYDTYKYPDAPLYPSLEDH